MRDNISFTVPMTYTALTATASMLNKLADDLLPTVASTVPRLSKTDIDEVYASLTEELSHKDVETGSPGIDPSYIEPEAKNVFASPIMDTATPQTITTEAELDAAGLPWDERIHSSAKTKTVKGFWKYLKGVDREVLVPQVEAELKGVVPKLESAQYAEDQQKADLMPQPVTSATGTSTPPAPPAPPAPTDSLSNVTTFAQLVTGITKNSIDELRVNAVLANVGLTNFALLGARPDLIPEVAKQLGL